MNFFGRDLQGPAKMIVIFAAILLASGGLCGLQIAIVSQSHEQYGGNLGGVFFLTGIIELAAMVVSLVGIVIVLIVWAIGALTRQGDDKALIHEPPPQAPARSDPPIEPQELDKPREYL